MTIECRGHVHSLRLVGHDRVAITFTLEASRLDAHPHQVEVMASRAEAEGYLPGMSIYALIRPEGKESKP